MFAILGPCDGETTVTLGHLASIVKSVKFETVYLGSEYQAIVLVRTVELTPSSANV